MANLLTREMSKFIATKPRFPGDLGYNLAFYAYRPDYTRADDRNIAMQAEVSAAISSIARGNAKVAMVVGSMSSGISAYHVLEHYNKSEELGKKVTSTQDLSRKIPKDILGPEIVAENVRRHNRTVELAANRFKDHYLDIPSDSEGMQRTIHDNKALAMKSWEDWTFEMHYWLPKILHDTDTLVYHGDKSFSRNGSLEQGLAAAIQYGVWLPTEIRQGKSIDVKDVVGRDIAPVDQAWEDAKHIVYVVEKGFDTDTAVALLLTRFMYEDWRRNNNESLVAEYMHKSVSDQSFEDMQKMDRLQELMMPYLLKKCHTPAMREVLRNDESLKTYWHVQAEIYKDAAPLDAKELMSELFSYIPRGGYAYPEVEVLNVEYRDAPSAANSFIKPSGVRRQLGTVKDPFAEEFGENMLYPNSGFIYDFRRMGTSADVTVAPSNDVMTKTQAAALLAVSAVESDRMPLGAPNKYLYLDDGASGMRAAEFLVKHKVSDWREAFAVASSKTKGGDNFYHGVVRQSEEDYAQRYYELLNMKEWRADNGIGNILSLSSMKEMMQQFISNREVLGAKREEAVAAQGSIRDGDAASVIARAADFQGLVIPKGALLSDGQYAQLLHGVMAATGQVEKAYSGGKYEMRFFYDDEKKDNPREIDFGDVLLLAGNSMKYFLEQGNVPNYRAIVYTAQMFDIYEKMIDPARRNAGENVIDWKQVNAVNPNFTAFTEQGTKAKAVRELWSELVGVKYDERGNVASRGLILEKGIHAFDKEQDLPAMPDKYRDAMRRYENKLAESRQYSVNAQAKIIRTPRNGL